MAVSDTDARRCSHSLIHHGAFATATPCPCFWEFSKAATKRGQIHTWAHALNTDLLPAPAKTVWPSGLRRWLQAPVRKGVGSNPTAVTFAAVAGTRRDAPHAAARSLRHFAKIVASTSRARLARLLPRGQLAQQAQEYCSTTRYPAASWAARPRAPPSCPGDPRSCQHKLKMARRPICMSERAFARHAHFWPQAPRENP